MAMSDGLPEFVVKPYSMNDAGYPVYRQFVLDSGLGLGGFRVASFVEEKDAHDYAEYRNNNEAVT